MLIKLVYKCIHKLLFLPSYLSLGMQASSLAGCAQFPNYTSVQSFPGQLRMFNN